MEKERKNFTEKSYEKLKNAIQEIVNEEDRKDVYVLSLCYTCDDEDLRFPKVTLSYNTLSNVKEESYNAASKEDAKWNYDYWLQTEIEPIIIHQQEFEETPILWTKKANPTKLIKEFLDYFDGDDE